MTAKGLVVLLVTRGAGAIALASLALIGAACDRSEGPGSDQNRPAPVAGGAPSELAVWGCDQSISSLDRRPEPHWRDDATVVGDFGFYANRSDFDVWRPNRDADWQFKLPIILEGHSGATVWVPASQQNRVAMILADVPRRGPGNSYLVEDGHIGVRFKPCANQRWSAWTAGLALVDRREIVLMVQEDGAAQPERVTLGPWRID